MGTLPEEEEYRAAQAAGGMDVARTFEEEVRDLTAMALGVMLLLTVLIVSMVAAYAVTRWTVLLVLNLLFCGLAVVAFLYLMYRRSRLVMRL